MTNLLRTAVAAAFVGSLGVATAEAQTGASRSAPQGDETLYSGRSIAAAPVAPREDQVVMGLHVPGSGPVAQAPWTYRR